MRKQFLLFFALIFSACLPPSGDAPQMTVTPDFIVTSTPPPASPTLKATSTPEPTTTPTAEQVTIGGVTLTLDENGVVTNMEATGASQEIKDDNMEKFDPSNYGLSNASIEKDETGIHVVVDGENVAKWAGTEWEWDWQVMEGLEGGNPLFNGFAKTYPTDSSGSVRQTSEVRADATEISAAVSAIVARQDHGYPVYVYDGVDKSRAIVARYAGKDELDPNEMIKTKEGKEVDGWVVFITESGKIVKMKFKDIEVFIRGFN